MSDYTVSKLDEIEEVTDGRCPWRPVRHHLGSPRSGSVRGPARKRVTGSSTSTTRQGTRPARGAVPRPPGRARFELGGERSTLRRARSSSSRRPEADCVRRGAGHDAPRLGGTPGRPTTAGLRDLDAGPNQLYRGGRATTRPTERGRESIAAHPEYALAALQHRVRREPRGPEGRRDRAPPAGAIESRRAAPTLANRGLRFDAVRDEAAFQQARRRALIMEARLEDVGSGRSPVTPGWFRGQLAHAAWLRNESFGGRATSRATGARPLIGTTWSRSCSPSPVSRWPCSSRESPPACTTRESHQEDFLVLAASACS